MDRTQIQPDDKESMDEIMAAYNHNSSESAVPRLREENADEPHPTSGISDDVRSRDSDDIPIPERTMQSQEPEPKILAAAQRKEDGEETDVPEHGNSGPASILGCDQASKPETDFTTHFTSSTTPHQSIRSSCQGQDIYGTDALAIKSCGRENRATGHQKRSGSPLLADPCPSNVDRDAETKGTKPHPVGSSPLNKPVRVRRRVVYSEQELLILNRCFSHISKVPSYGECVDLASQLGTKTADQLQLWFQNKRAMDKKNRACDGKENEKRDKKERDESGVGGTMLRELARLNSQANLFAATVHNHGNQIIRLSLPHQPSATTSPAIQHSKPTSRVVPSPSAMVVHLPQNSKPTMSYIRGKTAGKLHSPPGPSVDARTPEFDRPMYSQEPERESPAVSPENDEHMSSDPEAPGSVSARGENDARQQEDTHRSITTEPHQAICSPGKRQDVYGADPKVMKSSGRENRTTGQQKRSGSPLMADPCPRNVDTDAETNGSQTNPVNLNPRNKPDRVRRRVVYSEQELWILKRYFFNISKVPSYGECVDLASQLGTKTADQLQLWFQNKRAMEKKSRAYDGKDKEEREKKERGESEGGGNMLRELARLNSQAHLLAAPVHNSNLQAQNMINSLSNLPASTINSNVQPPYPTSLPSQSILRPIGLPGLGLNVTRLTTPSQPTGLPGSTSLSPASGITLPGTLTPPLPIWLNLPGYQTPPPPPLPPNLLSALRNHPQIVNPPVYSPAITDRNMHTTGAFPSTVIPGNPAQPVWHQSMPWHHLLSCVNEQQQRGLNSQMVPPHLHCFASGPPANVEPRPEIRSARTVPYDSANITHNTNGSDGKSTAGENNDTAGAKYEADTNYNSADDADADADPTNNCTPATNDVDATKNDTATNDADPTNDDTAANDTDPTNNETAAANDTDPTNNDTAAANNTDPTNNNAADNNQAGIDHNTGHSGFIRPWE